MNKKVEFDFVDMIAENDKVDEDCKRFEAWFTRLFGDSFTGKRIAMLAWAAGIQYARKEIIKELTRATK